MATVRGPSAIETAFAGLLRDAGLATVAELTDALVESHASGRAVDEILAVDAAELRAVMSHAWRIPVIDLANDWIDVDLVRRWEGSAYIEQRWLPVRDQADGSVLVATSREPEPELTAAIEGVVTSRVAYAATTSADIRAAVERAFATAPVIRSWRLARRVPRTRD
ncbi:MAG: hypothetical protein V4479_03395 [Actinomycetota bacterium]